MGDRRQRKATVIHGRRLRLWDYRTLVRRLAVRHIRARYSHSILGIYWAFVNPLLTATVMAAVFGTMLRMITPEAPFVVFIFSGLMLWNFLSNSVLDASTSVSDYAMLLGKVRFPREVLPIAAVVARMLDFGFALAVLGIFMFGFGVPLTWTALWAAPILCLLLVLTLGIALAVAALNSVYRDVGQITGLALLLLFYLSPVIYSLSQVPEPYRSWLMLNPIAPLIDAFRTCVVLGRPPAVTDLLAPAVLSLVVLGTGWWTFRRLEHQFAEIL